MSARFHVLPGAVVWLLLLAGAAATEPCIDFGNYLRPLNPPGQFPQLRSVVVEGNRAYAADRGIVVIDVTDPRNVVRLGGLSAGQFTETLAVSGRYAYLTNAWDGILVVDVLDPAQPVVVGSVDFSGFAYDIALNGQLAYVTGRYHTLTTIDVSVPAQPVVRHVLAGEGESVAIAGSRAVVCDGGVLIASLANPIAPAIVGRTYPAGLNGVAVAAAGHFAYVADRYHGMRVIDFSDPVHPVQVGSVDFENENFDIVAHGNLVLVVGAMRTAVVDVAVPTAPAVIGTVETGVGAYHIAVANGLAYLPAGRGLRVLDLGRPFSPPVAGSLATPGWVDGMAVDGDRVFVVNELGLLAIDIANRAAPAVVGSLDLPDVTVDLDLAGGRAYVAGAGGGVHVVEITEPRTPVLLKSVPALSRANAIQVHGRHAYVADGWFGLQVLDIAPSTVIAPRSALDLPGNAVALSVAGTTALVSTLNPAALRIIDVTKPGSPTLLGSFLEGESVTAVVQDGGLACVASWGGHLWILDMALPASPRILGETWFFGQIRSLTLDGSLLYACGDEGVEIVDIGDPGLPRPLGAAAARWCQDVAVAGDVLCLSRDSYGFQLLPMQCDESLPAAWVPLDIKPDDPANTVSCSLRGLLAVATPAGNGFEPESVDHASVRFGPNRAVEAHTGPWGPVRHCEDVDADGDVDLVFHFRLSETGIQCGDTKAELTGRLRDGREFRGIDAITTSWGWEKDLAAQVDLRVAPNPFNPRTTVTFELAVAGPVRLDVFDLAGRLVRTLLDCELLPGAQEVAWDGRDASGRDAGSGSYVVRLVYSGGTRSARLGLLR